MARIDIAPELVEEAVFLVLRQRAERGERRAADWLEARERNYVIPDSSQREAAFGAHALGAFRALRFDEPLRMALEACPSAARRLDALYVRRARRAKEESAELYCAPPGDAGAVETRTVLALRPERFGDVEGLYEFVRRELLYVDDMLDERFGYDPEAIDRLELEPGLRDVVRERVSTQWRRRIELRARGEKPAGDFLQLTGAAVASLESHSLASLGPPSFAR